MPDEEVMKSQVTLIYPENKYGGGILRVADYVKYLLNGIYIKNKPNIISIPTYKSKIYKFKTINKYRSTCVILLHVSHLQPFLLDRKTHIILFVHGIELFMISELYAKLLLNRANYIICNSIQTKEQVVGLIGNNRSVDKIKQVYYPGKKPIFKIDEYSRHAKSIFITVTRLESSESYKNIERLIHYWAKYKIQIPLIIIGDGSARNYFENEVLKHKVNVVLKGFVSDDELEDFYAKSYGSVLLSSKEGQGLFYFESLQRGIPVIALRNSVASEFIKSGFNGYLMDLDDDKTFNNSIEECIRMEFYKRIEISQNFSNLNVEETFKNVLINQIKVCVE